MLGRGLRAVLWADFEKLKLETPEKVGIV